MVADRKNIRGERHGIAALDAANGRTGRSRIENVDGGDISGSEGGTIGTSGRIDPGKRSGGHGDNSLEVGGGTGTRRVKKTLKGVQAMLQHVEKPVVTSYYELDLIELVLVDVVEEAHGVDISVLGGGR
jgi:hypothetical protein